jgi:hypothetical protein
MKSQDYFSQEKGVSTSDYRDQRKFMEVLTPLKKGVIRDTTTGETQHFYLSMLQLQALSKVDSIQGCLNGSRNEWQMLYNIREE